MIWLVSIFSVLAVVFLVYGLIEFTLSYASDHRIKATGSAEVSLTEMFIFVDPQKLYLVSILLVVFGFLVVWLLSGVWVIAIIVAFVLFKLPGFIINFLKKRRTNQFIDELPDVLNSASTMMRAGSTLSLSLETIVEESKGPIAQEFGLFLREVKVGVPFSEALDNLKERMPIQELELVIAGIKINREIGGSLAEVLQRLSDTLRRKNEMEGKIEALTAQGKAQGYVMTGLPVFLAIVLMKMEPVAMGRLFTEWIGWLTCATFCIFMFVGYKFIQKIVNIDV